MRDLINRIKFELRYIERQYLKQIDKNLGNLVQCDEDNCHRIAENVRMVMVNVPGTGTYIEDEEKGRMKWTGKKRTVKKWGCDLHE